MRVVRHVDSYINSISTHGCMTTMDQKQQLTKGYNRLDMVYSYKSCKDTGCNNEGMSLRAFKNVLPKHEATAVYE